MGMEIYWILGIVGVSLTLLLVIFDGILDFMAEPVFLMLAFTAGIFGFAGVGANELLPHNTLALMLAPTLIALVSTSIFYFAYQSLKKIDAKDAEFKRNPQALMGKVGVVSWWHGTEGEIIVDYVGQPTTIKAHAELPLSSGAEVFVTSIVDESTVQVNTHPVIEK